MGELLDGGPELCNSIRSPQKGSTDKGMESSLPTMEEDFLGLSPETDAESNNAYVDGRQH